MSVSFKVYFEKILSRPVLWVLVLLGLGLAVYSTAIFHPFVHDDVEFILRNPGIARLDTGALVDIFRHPPEGMSGVVNIYYRPVLEVIYRLQYRLFGFTAPWYHLFNILLHVINSALLFAVLNRMFDRSRTAHFVIAAVFLVHPLQTESVAYIAGISDLMFTLLCLASFLCYLHFRDNNKSGEHALFYGLAIVIFLTGLFAKEQSVILPFIIILYEWCRGGFREDRARVTLAIGGFVVTALCYFVMRKILVGDVLNLTLGSPSELMLRLKSIPAVLLTYLGLIVYPAGLHFYRSHDILTPAMGPSLVMALVVMAIIWLVIRLNPKQKRQAIFGLGVFIIALAPTLNIIPMVLEYSHIFTAEHFLYFPMIGVLIFAAAVIGDMDVQRRRPGWTAVGMMAGICALSVVTMRQNTYYRSEIALFERTLRFEPQLSRIHYLLAHAYYRAGQFERSIQSSRISNAILETYISKAKIDEARRHYQLSVKNNDILIAMNFMAVQKWESAREVLDKALKIDPRDTGALNLLGTVYFYQGDPARSRQAFEQSLSVNPRNPYAAGFIQNVPASGDK